MTDDLKRMIDPNTANTEDLQQLAGVGPSLAERIIAARPFRSKEDLLRVKGIGEVLLQRWEGQLDLSTAHLFTEEPVEHPAMEARIEVLPPVFAADQAAESILPVMEPVEALPEPDAEIPTAVSVAAEPVPAEPAQPIPDPVPAAEDGEKVSKKQPISRTQFWLSLLIGGFLCFLFSLLFSLGILALVNGGDLRFAKPAEVTALRLEVTALNGRLDTQTQEMEILRERVGALEGLGERMSAAEGAISELQLSLQEVEDNLAETQMQVDALESKTEKFTQFFESLRDLFIEFFPSIETTEVEP